VNREPGADRADDLLRIRAKGELADRLVPDVRLRKERAAASGSGTGAAEAGTVMKRTTAKTARSLDLVFGLPRRPVNPS